MKKIILVLMTAVLLLVSLPSCSRPVQGQEIKSNLPRNTSPAVSQTDLTTLVNGNNAFAFDLFQVLRQNGGNLFYSPYSISEALAMTYAGARGDTETGMANALDFILPQDKLHPAFNDLDLLLQQRGASAQGDDGQGFRLNIANAIWGQQGFNFLSSYLDVLAQNYGAGMRITDFMKDPENSRIEINNWVSDNTSGKIKDLLPAGSVTDITRLVLTNAVYFNAAWASQFNKSSTADGTFNTLNNGAVTVPMMHQTESFNYAEGNNYQAVELPYDGNELSMVVIMPKAGQYESFEQSLTSDAVSSIVNSLQSQEVVLTMPKFSYDATAGLKAALTQLGMGTAFTDAADFSGMDDKHDLLIQDVLHKAYVSVDENGTEAAAATAVIVGTTAMPVSQAELNINQPFIFFIRDNQTGSIIFVGRVLNPAA